MWAGLVVNVMDCVYVRRTSETVIRQFGFSSSFLHYFLGHSFHTYKGNAGVKNILERECETQDVPEMWKASLPSSSFLYFIGCRRGYIYLFYLL